MSRPVTLFTGQWADLPFEEICAKGAELFGRCDPDACKRGLHRGA